MARYVLSLAALLTVGLSAGWSQKSTLAGPPAEEKGAYLGVLCAPVPDVLYDQLPQLPREQGVVVSHVLPDSPAARVGLRRNDVVLKYGDEKVRDCEHFARLIHDDKPNRKVCLTYLRGGKEATAEATLALGPLLRISAKAAGAGPDDQPRGTAKSANNPNAVSISATPLGGNTMKLTIEYYDAKAGRARSVPCSGTPDEIDTQVRDKLPENIQELVKAALRRLHDPQANGPTSPSKR